MESCPECGQPGRFFFDSDPDPVALPWAEIKARRRRSQEPAGDNDAGNR